MKVEFLARFNKDVEKLDNQKIKNNLISIISELESAQKLNEIKNLKKLKGYRNAYRIKIGDYRFGFYFEDNIILCARIAHRKDIYKLFP